jgi:hypothetical protein
LLDVSSLIMTASPMFAVVWSLNRQALFDFVSHDPQSCDRPRVDTVMRECTKTAQHLTNEVRLCHGDQPAKKTRAERRFSS